MNRRYQLKQRAKDKDATRQKIVEAAIELHQSKGLSATSFADIAERADVGRVTVYRHFPDETSLVLACSGQYFGRFPPPEIETWKQIKDAGKRLAHALQATYRYHRQTEPMMSSVLPEVRGMGIMEPYDNHWRRAVEILAEPFHPTPGERPALEAGLALALDFETWRLLVHSRRLSERAAINLVSKVVLCSGQKRTG
jgi:AcrR family transcriptional regulator